MQQLTLTSLKQGVQLQEESLRIDLPLPDNLAKARQFIRQFCQLVQGEASNEYLGADRLQVTVRVFDIDYLLCIEWLCDAMWLTASDNTSNDTLASLYNWIHSQTDL